MLTAVIIDDEPNNVDNLQLLLAEYCPQVTVAATAMNADKGREIISLHRPELVFLDIQMPGKNGFDLLQSLSNFSFEVVFVTAYDQYAIQAIKFAALDYLLKPIKIPDLISAVEKAVVKINSKKQNLQLENLVQLLHQRQKKDEHRIALPALKETRFIKTKDIIRCESSNSYTTFYLAAGDKVTVSKPIYEFEEILADYGFIRCHQSHIVNVQCIASIVKEDGGYLTLEDKTQIPVSRNKKDAVKAALEGR